MKVLFPSQLLEAFTGIKKNSSKCPKVTLSKKEKFYSSNYSDTLKKNPQLSKCVKCPIHVYDIPISLP